MADPGQFICIAKKEFVPISNDLDELPISNLGALRMGLEALQKEDASDTIRANELWTEALALLAKESQDDEGAGAQGYVQVDDIFDLAGISSNCVWQG
jgi:hypothetical protein